jgi:uncharacterized membrane protein YebE (DUF533 family)
MMKKVLIAVGAMTLLVTGMAYVQAESPVSDQLQTNQEGAALLKKEQPDIDNMKNAAKADGVVTKEERARIGAAQTRASAQANTPGVDRRQTNQQRRIDRGIASGQLTEEEAARMKQQQEDIKNMESAAKADGVVTKEERAKIQAAQNRASKNIFREKHDREGKRHQ